mmetsp:Transcript_4882/g.18725  ORF Transcript_4882/g.18725 Transcript_4882/m.18725 type:complete len:272 (-) Transcript_4882:127-942(-)
MIFVVQTNDSNDALERLRREQLLQSHVPHLGHFLERSHLVQPRNDRPRIIQRVRASELFREAILIARQLQNRAARAPRDDPRPRARRAQHHHRAALPLHRHSMRERVPFSYRRSLRALSRIARRLRHRDLHLLSLLAPDANQTLAVAHDHGGAEAHLRPALGDFRDARHLDDGLLHPVVLLAAATAASAAATTASAAAPAARARGLGLAFDFRRVCVVAGARDRRRAPRSDGDNFIASVRAAREARGRRARRGRGGEGDGGHHDSRRDVDG